MLVVCKNIIQNIPEPGLEGLALSFEVASGEVPEWIQVVPFGTVHTEKYGDFIVDEQSVTAILEHFSQLTNDLVVDYEHQTLYGQEAPAAAWVKELADRGPDGIWARVEWTPRAAEYLANKEYRYFSPVLLRRVSDNRAIRLHSGALTNTPAIDGMVPLVNKAVTQIVNKEGSGMDELLEQLRWMLNLPMSAGATEILAELQKLIDKIKTDGEVVAAKDVLGVIAGARLEGIQLNTQVVAAKEILDELDLPETADANTVKGKIIALKNPSGYVRVEEFNELKDKLAVKERDDLVALAMSQGKIAPAQKEWAEAYALKDPAGFKSFIDQAPQVVPMGQIDTGNPTGGKGGSLDEAQLLVNKQLGLSDEAFKQYGGDQ